MCPPWGFTFFRGFSSSFLQSEIPPGTSSVPFFRNSGFPYDFRTLSSSGPEGPSGKPLGLPQHLRDRTWFARTECLPTVVFDRSSGGPFFLSCSPNFYLQLRRSLFYTVQASPVTSVGYLRVRKDRLGRGVGLPRTLRDRTWVPRTERVSPVGFHRSSRGPLPFSWSPNFVL